jgi:hypothetical protein
MRFFNAQGDTRLQGFWRELKEQEPGKCQATEATVARTPPVFWRRFLFPASLLD